MMSRLAIALVHKYPQPWRDRYSDEVLELLRESPARLSDVGELLRGLIVERARALIEDSDHPKRTARILSAMQPLFTLLFTLPAIGLGVTLRSRRPMPGDIADVVAWGVIIAVFGFIAILFRRRRKVGWSYPQLPLFSSSTGLTSLPVVFAGIVLLEWTPLGVGYRSHEPGWANTLNLLYRLWIYGCGVSSLSSAFWPGRQMLVALGQLEGLEEAVKSAEQWVAGCHEVAALGMAAPLDDAERLLSQRIRERDEVRKQLNALGYRARFERSL